MGDRGYWVPEKNLPRLKKKIGALSRRAAKLGCGEITLDLCGHKDVPMGDGCFVRVYQVAVSGEAPVLAGWRLVAVLQHDTPGGGNIIRRVPGGDDEPDLDAKWRTVEPWCEHCRLSRRRKDTYLVMEVETRQVKQVGSDCLKDFTGHERPEDVVRYAEFLIQASDALYDASDIDDADLASAERYYDLSRYLEWVAANIRSFGWVSRGMQYDDPTLLSTANRAASCMENMAARDGLEVTPVDATLAREALAWARKRWGGEPDPEQVGEFDWNMAQALAGDVIGPRETGLAAYVVRAYQKERVRLQEAQHSSWVGRPGERIRLVSLTCTQNDIRESYYARWGRSTYHALRFVDGLGNVYVWLSSSRVADAIVPGQTYSGYGTVKRHDERDGLKVTVLKNCRWDSVR